MDDKPFNRGLILNIGINILYEECDYFIFHDVDYFSNTVDIYKIKDNSGSLIYNSPIYKHNINTSKYEGFFGGVTMMLKDDLDKINGFNNDFWGWGCEDDDLLERCKLNNINIERYKGNWGIIDHDGDRFGKNKYYNNNLLLLNKTRSGNKTINGFKNVDYVIKNIIDINNNFINYNDYVKNANNLHFPVFDFINKENVINKVNKIQIFDIINNHNVHY
jgi:predicted glycosyltransferase involved in capsule biosynthesis